MEKAKSVIERSATTFKNLKLFLLLSPPFSVFSISELKKLKNIQEIENYLENLHNVQ